jgi:hypothetical protein
MLQPLIAIMSFATLFLLVMYGQWWFVIPLVFWLSIRYGAIFLMPCAFLLDGYYGQFNTLPVLFIASIAWYVFFDWLSPRLLLYHAE